ncbi:class I SAM-dependent methyltransferase [Paracoccus pacificus]|uniref:Class I SAM-dependent methyltransferase n=1 Tax=Paracoccus pacificus TaxID=1463598 RepID=A0ABW4R8U5_9RHOB
MPREVSPRIAAYVAALPLVPGMRILEIGCGPGVAARLCAGRIGDGKVVAIDRSATAIRQATTGSAEWIAQGRLEFRCVAVEDFTLDPSEVRFDLAFAMRVGALDGRHPAQGQKAFLRLKDALRPEGLLFIDGRPPVSGNRLGAGSGT